MVGTMEWRLNLTDDKVFCSIELLCITILPCGLRMALYTPGCKLSYIPGIQGSSEQGKSIVKRHTDTHPPL